jgi:chromosome segregation ATPase
MEAAPVPPRGAAAAEKTGFITTTEQKLKDFDTKIDELAKKSGGYKDDAKAQAEQALATLREQRAKLNEQFDNLKKSSTEAWKELKIGFEAAFSELEKAYENAKSKFS